MLPALAHVGENAVHSVKREVCSWGNKNKKNRDNT
jgi:hypothetical protein